MPLYNFYQNAFLFYIITSNNRVIMYRYEVFIVQFPSRLLKSNHSDYKTCFNIHCPQYFTPLVLTNIIRQSLAQGAAWPKKHSCDSAYKQGIILHTPLIQLVSSHMEPSFPE